ncbi:MAG: sulfatase [Siphonobacter aquaeclarae]|nr:sulfatase [Siphonobacter aquaeclarae]
MRNLFTVCLLLLVCSGTRQSGTRPSGTRPSAAPPNIIVFLVDDMGWQDTSVPFWKEKTPLNRRYHTPAMERMAREGIVFTDAYATPLCTPSRISLMTGLNAARHRVTNWTSPIPDTSTDYADTTLLPVDWNINGLSPQPGTPRTVVATALPALLAQKGYYTVHCGKAHFGSKGKPGADPKHIGFAVNIAGNEIGHPGSYLGTENYDHPSGGKPGRNAVPGLEAYHGTETFLTEALTKEALKALDQRGGKPFFLYLAHYAIHTPIMGDPRFVDRYLKEGLPPVEARYASLIEGMDKSLGDVLNYLDEKGLAQNTLVVFMSDNGGLSLSPPRSAPAHTHNAPLRAGKGSVYEGGIREPMLVRWPGVASAGKRSEAKVLVEDFFPTILDVAGGRRPAGTIDGQSFLPVIKNPERKGPERPLVWHHPNRWIAEEGPLVSWASAIRLGDWKLVYDQRREKCELYNLKDDIGETNDLALARPETTRKLALALSNYLRERNAQMPVFRASGKAVRWPDEVVR